MRDIEHEPDSPDAPSPAAVERPIAIVEPAQTEIAHDGQSRAAQAAFIDRCLVSEPEIEPGRLAGWWENRQDLATPSEVSRYLIEFFSGGLTPFLLVLLAAAGTFVVVANLPDMNGRDAFVIAGCAGVLAPVVVIAAIRLIDVLLRAAVLAMAVVLVVGLLGLVGHILFAR